MNRPMTNARHGRYNIERVFHKKELEIAIQSHRRSVHDGKRDENCRACREMEGRKTK